MNSVARTRCCTFELLGALALLSAAPVRAQEPGPRLEATVVVGGGYVDNPFFDDTLQDAVTDLAGPVGFVAPGLGLEIDAGAHRLALRGSGRLTRHAGAADALGGHGALGLSWRGPRRAGFAGAASVEARLDHLDRYPEDDRQQVRADSRLHWQPTYRTWLQAGVGGTARTYPERPLETTDDQGELQLDETLQGGVGPLRLGPLSVDLELGAGAWQVDANINRLDRRGGQAQGAVLVSLGQFGVEASAGRWVQSFDVADREDDGTLLGAALSVTPASWWSVRADARRLASDSTAAEGRFTQWQAMVSVAFSLTTSLAPAAWLPLGVERLADGRWRVVAELPDARRVDVVGDFNGWRVGASPMRPADPPGRWVAELTLPPGAHGFMYVIDKTRYVTPAGVPTREDGFGQQVGVLRVPREGQP
ncbi:MAG: hypothetical protein H6706_10330 [Myxococcales bacterium]|nr:hypothetical protein [Myxococcales bacterium]